MGLPIISRSWSQQWVERLLPVDKGMGSDHIDDGLSNRPKPRNLLLRRLHIAAVAHGKDQHVLAMPFRGQEWQRRSLPQDRPTGQFVRRRFERLTIVLENVHRVFERMDDETRQDLRTELLKLKFKSGDGSEVAAAATERPKQNPHFP